MLCYFWLQFHFAVEKHKHYTWCEFEPELFADIFCCVHCRLTADEYLSLSSNLVDLASVHKDLLSSLEDTFRFAFFSR